MNRILLLLLLLTGAACVERPSNIFPCRPDRADLWPIWKNCLVRHVDPRQWKEAYAAELPTWKQLPTDAQKAALVRAAEQWKVFSSTLERGDEVWVCAEEHSTGKKKSFVLLRGSCVAGEMVISEES
jgi:hypothetical protein